MLRPLKSKAMQDEAGDPPTTSGVGFAIAVQHRDSVCEGIRNGEYLYVGWLMLD